MLYTLIRRDITWKITLTMIVVGAFFGAFSTRFSFFFLFNGYILCAALAKPYQRATLFEATLPITARDLFLSRTLSLLSMVLLPVSTLCATRLLTQGQAQWNDSLTTLALGVLLSLAMLFAVCGKIQELASSVWILPAAAPVLFAAGMLLTFEPGYTWAILAFSVSFGIFWFWRTWEAIPNSFQVAPLEVAEADAAAGPEFGLTSPRVDDFPDYLQLADATWIPLVGMQAATGDWFIGCVFGVASFGSVASRLSWLFTLPIRRRVLLAYLMLPLGISMFAGFAYHSLSLFDSPVHLGAGEALRRDSRVDKLSTPTVQVPAEFWRHAPDGVPPQIRAPWGETHVPSTVSVLGVALYNPYSVGPRRSQEFLEWQFGNATEGMLGRRFTLAEYNAGELSPDRLRNRGLVPATRQLRFLILELTAIWSALLIMTCGAELAISYRVNRLPKMLRRTVTWTLGLAPGTILLVKFSIPVVGASNDAGEFLVREALLRLSAALPQGLAPVVVFGAVVVGVLCWLAIKLFNDVELLTVTPKPGLWSR